MSDARWTVSGPRRPGAVPLYCFPHGGGSAAEYVRWGRELAGAEVRAVQLPGRGTRLREPAPTSMTSLVAELAENLPLHGRFAFFGHSLGALVAYELTAALLEAGRPLPERLVLSAMVPPDSPRDEPDLHTLHGDELVAEVDRRHGGFPPEVLADEALRRLLADYLRADYQVLETYEWPRHAPLPVPFTVFGGRDDSITEPELRGWGRHSQHRAGFRMFPGGHFYLRDQGPSVRRAVAAALRQPAPGVDLEVAA